MPNARPAPGSSLASILLAGGLLLVLLSRSSGQAQVLEGEARPPTAQEIALGYRADRLIAKPKAAARQAAGFAGRAAAVQARLGVRVQRDHGRVGGMQTLAVSGGGLAVKIEALKASGLYEYVEPDWIVHASLTPDDPRLASGELWGLNNLGQNGGMNDADIDGPEAWDTRHDAPSVIVAVIDSGVRHSHEDIAANMWRNPGESGGGKETNGIDDDADGWIDNVFGIDTVNRDGNPMDDHGHGSHCAGTVAAVGNNGLGVVGVAWQAQIMACKFLASNGSGSTSDAITCIDFARTKGAHILSNSWGGGGYSQALRDAIASARLAGMIFVAAAGNAAQNNDLVRNYPSNYEEDNVVAVASITRQDTLSGFSNFGSGLVDVAAPGSEIVSLGIGSDSSYATLSGTSMATPHVAGALALLKAQFPADGYRQLINRLLRTTVPTPALAGTTLAGGRINLADALAGGSSAPFNDDFATARILTQNALRVRSSNVAATLEVGEPENAGVPDGDTSVWWRWTAQSSGTVGVSTSGSDFDTVLGVYTGGDLGTLALVAANDNALAGGTTSELTFSAAAGVTYAIAISGKGGDTGRVIFNLGAPPTNDHFTDATTVSGSTVEVSNVANLYASKESGEPAHGGNPGGASVWWTWTAPSNGVFTATSSGSAIDTLLAIYTGAAVQALTLVTENDDEAPGLTTSRAIFNATAGTIYRIAIDGKNGATGRLALVIAQPPVNDAFANRLTLSGSATTVTAANIGATKEASEPAHAANAGGASVWWTWTAATTATVTIDTIGSNFDTTLAAYTGTALAALTNIASNDDAVGLASRITFTAIAGTTYQVVVDGYDNDTGNITLRLAVNSQASNDHFANRAVIPGGDATVTGSNVGATKETGEPNHAGNAGGASVWWAWTAPATGAHSVSTGGSGFDTLLAVYTGSAVGALTPVASNDNFGSGLKSKVTFAAIAGTQYQIAIDGAGGAVGSISLSVAAAPPGPVNDHFAAATAIAVGETSVAGTNGNATKEAAEPNHAAGTGGTSVWWTWTAPASGVFYGSTDGSSFDTLLAIYSGTALGALTPIASDDDSGAGLNSRTAFQATAGTTYRIAVDGASGTTGSITLSFGASSDPLPENDLFSNRAPLAGTAFAATSNSALATKEPGEPNHHGRPGGKSVWWTWTAPSHGLLTVQTGGSAFDTVLAVYTGAPVGGLTFVASNDDSGSGSSSQVTFPATGGATYVLAVDGYSGEGGAVALHGSFVDTNSAPVALADIFVGAPLGVPTVLSVRANDTDANGDTLTVTGTSGAPPDATVTHDGNTVTFTAGASMGSTGVNTFSYSISDGFGGTASGLVNVYRSPAALWRAEKFGVDAANEAIAGDGADPNQNGIVNLLEYTLGGDPVGLGTDASKLPKAYRHPLTHRLVLNFVRLPDRTDLVLTVQGADSPEGPWTNLARSTGAQPFTPLVLGTGAAESDIGIGRAVSISDQYPMTDPAHRLRFLRLEVTRP